MSAMSLVSRGVLPEVRHGFTTFDGPDAEWKVRRFHLAEGLSEPYQLVLELISTDIHVDVPSLLGSACQLSLARDDNTRSVFGLVQRVETTGLTPDHIGVRIELAPACMLMSQVVNIRFWQGKSAVDILKEVLTAPLRDLGRTVRLDLDESAYEAREYCVQYRESDFEFASRLMQEEGIVYYFDHAADERAEVLVLLAVSSDCPELKLGDDLEAVPFVPESGGTRHTESVHHFGWCSSLRSTSVVQRDFDWVHPSDSPYHRGRHSKDARARDREVYEHDDRRLLLDDGEHRARRKLEELAASGEVGRGQSDVLESIPGHRVALVGHPQAELDRTYLLTRVVHTGEAPDASPFAHSAGGGPRYANTFECIPQETPFQPSRRLSKPRAHGPQTGVVVGPEGEEIHTDQQGRIKVLFHWDRLSPRDDTASCWIRVTQKWAGPGWGFMFLPRIGMEVLVEFLDGDPERPIVTGCVYNGVNAPPYSLPGEKTKSTIKSESSLGAGGSNELRFEDAKGSEEIFIHAQKDLNEVIENDNTRTIKHNQSFSVTGSQSFSVGSQSFSVTGDRSVTVSKGDESLTVSAGKSTTKVQKDREVTVVAGNSKLAVTAGTHTEKASGLITIASSPGGLDISGAAAVALKSTGDGLTLTGGKGVTVTAALESLSLTGHTATTLKSDTTTVSISAPTEVKLDSPATIKVQGKAVTISGGESITLSVGSSSIKIESSGVTISGPKISSSAVGVQEITGALVKIN